MLQTWKNHHKKKISPAIAALKFLQAALALPVLGELPELSGTRFILVHESTSVTCRKTPVSQIALFMQQRLLFGFAFRFLALLCIKRILFKIYFIFLSNSALKRPQQPPEEMMQLKTVYFEVFL